MTLPPSGQTPREKAGRRRRRRASAYPRIISTPPPYPRHRKVLLTGGSGFVGRAVLRRLLDAGFAVRALVRTRGRGSPDPIPPHPAVELFPADLLDPASVAHSADTCTDAIHLVGIIAEQPGRGVTFPAVHVGGTRAVLAACKAAGVRRLIHMSALGTRENAVSAYHQSKFAAENLVRESGLDFTILRPSMITGADGQFTQMVRGWATRQAAPYFFFPYFRAGLLGLGEHRQVQPVAVDDVARTFVEALSNPLASGKTYDLVGPDRYTWPEFYRSLARHAGFPSRAAVPIPLWYAELLTRIVPAGLLPFNRSQVQMAGKDNTGDASPFAGDFGWSPRSFS